MKKMIKIKSLLGIITCSLLLVLFACSDNILDQQNNNATSTANFGTSVEQVESAINGAFHPITGTFFWGRIIHTGAMLRSDEFNVFPFGSNTAMSTFLGNPGDRWATEPWQELYKSIARCNNVIINVTEEGIPDQTTRENLVGQAYFLRAFDYWYLVNLYGNVPLITELPDLDNLLVEQATPESIWAQIISDLEMAETMLPESWTGEDLGRPTSGAATALKGKSYLYMEQFGPAATTLGSLVGKYSLLPAANFGENFSTTNENNSESVFELQFLGQQTFVWGSDIPGTGSMGNYHIDYATPTKSPDKGHLINPWLKDLFEANGDTVRRNETLLYDYPGATGYGGASFNIDLADTLDEDGNVVAGDLTVAADAGLEAIYGKKYSGMDLGARGDVDFLGTNVGNNWRIIRYADVLLMLAEALNEDNMTSQAIQYIDMVRDRANLTLIADTNPGINQADMRQAIIEERAMELAGEGHRFFDLVRWDLADDYLGATSLHGAHPKSLSGGVFQSNKHELIWIPNSERDSNPNLDQNPGYN
ncbi:RagB/SusD family nutrient uptake outer membrane protein [Flavivirga abyssicola]|uniref:RagB/SusD family nutrient uptake outer membrane protein n=1 Tax=Flavivirga abyssicola TaxID=3063533 RepID=UPI0026DF986E|nr:RagB/SusD family nutrient uptake outer membrane protein [Flavivirga sp. MEBiC07777]WVK14997.1 RagB/SusD family nutrient uptake outer membrane protein [Flavivirga sp. MEBiC07777]